MTETTASASSPTFNASFYMVKTDGTAIWFNPNKVNNHFGETPLYGTQHLVCVESPQYCK